MHFETSANHDDSKMLKTPTKHCVELVKQADLILDDLHRRSSSQKANVRPVRLLPSDFLNAMDYLKIRVKSSKNFQPTRFTRPVLTVSEKLGPGTYNISRPTTPQLQTYSGIFLSPSKSSRSSRRVCKTPDFIEKNKIQTVQVKSPQFVHQHNTKIQNFQELRKKDKEKKRRKNRLKFMESVNQRVKQEVSKSNKEVFKHFALLIMTLGLTSTCKKLRTRSSFLLTWLTNIAAALGKIMVRTKRIRKTFAFKNIIGLAHPFFRLAVHKRSKFKKTLQKSVKSILQMNLLFLLMHQWQKCIKTIQSAFRAYQVIKKIRIASLVQLFDDLAEKNEKPWKDFPPGYKKGLVEKFLAELMIQHSKKACKYFYDLGCANKSFGRNYSLMGGAIMSDLMGRGVRIFQLRRPWFKVFARKDEICKFLDSCEKPPDRALVSRKQKKGKRGTKKKEA